MKRLTSEEYHHRLEVINRAMMLYGEQVGGNITKALEMLNEPGFMIPAESMKGLTGSEMDSYERIRCIDCGAETFFRLVPPNDEGIKLQIVCNECKLVLDSDKSLDEWKEILGKR
jgi:hypothetical protein